MSSTISASLLAVPSAQAVTVEPGIFGFNIEITRKGCWKGLAAEMAANRKFAAVGNDGFPKRWHAFGDGNAAKLCTVDGYAGKQCVRVDQKFPGRAIGIVQEEDSLKLLPSQEYALRLAVKTDRPMEISLRLSGENEQNAVLNWPIAPGDWQLVQGKLSPSFSGQARLEIVSTEPGTFFIGAVSLMPSDNFCGMRRDVVELLKKLRPSALRYPGGCYAEFYPWREALLPVDQRPPIGPTNLWFLLTDGDDYDMHEIGVNEFLALCKEIGAAPAITARMNEASPDDAAELVEYCNGSAGTTWGAKRIALGGAEYPPVRTWFLGNELWSFGHDNLNRAEQCGEKTARFAAAMRKKDPGLQLIGCTFYDRHDWNRAIVRQAGELLDGYSLHCYLVDRFCGRLGEVMHAAEIMLEPFICQVRDGLRRAVPAGREHTILFDEWNFRWGGPGTIGMGVYVASTLHLLCRKAADFNISRAFFFMAVNEGIIDAVSQPAKLDIAGIIFELCRPHAGRKLLDITADSAELDCCATAEPDGSCLHVTMLNRSVSESVAVELPVPEACRAAQFRCTVWEPLFPDTETAKYRLNTRVVSIDGRGMLRIELPVASFAALSCAKKE